MSKCVNLKIITSLAMLCLLSFSLPSEALYFMKLHDLQHTPLPQNPIKVSGKVTSENPVMISDGGGTIKVTGISAKTGDFLVLIGNWTGSALDVPSLANCEMISITAGEFQVGTPDIYTGTHYVDEHPQHSVTLAAYSIGKYEVTRGEYKQFMNAGGYTNSAYWSADGWDWKVTNERSVPDNWTAAQTWTTGQTFTQTDNHPVIGVSYYEAEAFCNWAGGHLPTEAQWEVAARWDGHPRIYPWGDVWDAEKCNNYLDTNAASGGYQKFMTSVVGSYPSGASSYGCQDMAGNAAEWCQDWYMSYPGAADVFDRTGRYRDLRGGSWRQNADSVRCAYRNAANPSYSSNLIGFRLAR